MMNVCYQCGQYRPDKIIDPQGPYAICPECGCRHPFLRLPLFIVSGASAAGKSTLLQYLLGRVTEYVLLDSDILWRPAFNQPDNQYRDFFETWLRVCKNIGQSGRPAMLFGAGLGVPENIEACVERRYFSQVHYLALVCEDEVLSARLLNRPQWRNSHSAEFIEAQQAFNRWFKQSGLEQAPPITLVDTSSTSVEAAAEQVIAWSRART